ISILRLGVADAAAKEAWEALRKESERKLTSARAGKLLARIKAFEQAHGGTRFFAEHAAEIRRLAGVIEAKTAEGRLKVGLLHYWPFDHAKVTKTGGTAKDATGNGLDLVVSGEGDKNARDQQLQIADGIQGKALRLLKRNWRHGHFISSRTAPAIENLNGMEQLTLCAWVKPDQLDDGDGRRPAAGIVGRSLHAAAPFGICLFKLRPMSYVGSREKEHSVTGKTQLQIGEWMHIALVFDGKAPGEKRHKLYVNGVLEGSKPHPRNTTPESGPRLSIGMVHGVGGWVGLIDEVRIYSRPLSPAELRAIMGLAGKAAATTVPSAPAAEPGAKAVTAAETGVAPAEEELVTGADEATPDAKLEAALREFDAKLEARDFDGARRAIPAGPRDATAEAAARLAGFFAAWRDAARKGAGALKGSEAEIESRKGKVRGTVLEVDDSGITVVFRIKDGRRVIGESRTSVAWRDLTLRQEQKLAASGGWKLGGADGAVFDAVVALWRKDADAAEKALALARGHPLASHYRGRVNIQRFGEAEAAALRAWERAEKLFTAKDMKGAKAAYEAFEREHGKTRTAAKLAALLRERRDAIDLVIVPREIKVDLGGGVFMEFVLVPAGEFSMGDEDVAKPVHNVKITKPFYLGKYEVTQAQYERVMGVNPSEFKGAGFPVENVSWADTQKFVAKANALLTQSDGPRYTFRLPTEAEWEYACRAGTRTEYNTGQGEPALEKAGWYSKNSGGKTNPVGKKAPNALGLHDMHGNVAEIVQDRAGRYSAEPAVNPRGPKEGWNRVHRGGSWATEADSCRSASRGNDNPGHRRMDHGFRCVVETARQAVTTPATIH
ncbi:MAG: SUMF1/EgtB/PvdO family nonheme iron enzyme, partial [Planctomycetota bacterium]